MGDIIKWIVSVLAGIIAVFILITKKMGSGGTTSQETKDHLDSLKEKIKEKQKEVDKVVKETDELYEKNDQDVNNPVPPVVNTVDTANELWINRKR